MIPIWICFYTIKNVHGKSQSRHSSSFGSLGSFGLDQKHPKTFSPGSLSVLIGILTPNLSGICSQPDWSALIVSFIRCISQWNLPNIQNYAVFWVNCTRCKCISYI